MNDKMYIPKKLNVGYQNRSDTYTGKLAYVVYTDDTGKIRKEASWNNWSDKDIPKQDFDNDPISGFVINRDAGGKACSYGWDSRLEKVRVYDPRGFEIEITIPNLLFILEECNAMKGKGIEGELVYAWHGTTLVLLPTSSARYAECIKFTKIQASNITPGQLVPGHWYIFKDGERYMYLGKKMYYPNGYCTINAKGSKKHIFLPSTRIDEKLKYSYYNPKFLPINTPNVKVDDGEDLALYNEAVAEFISSMFNTPATITTLVPLDKFNIDTLNGGNNKVFKIDKSKLIEGYIRFTHGSDKDYFNVMSCYSNSIITEDPLHFEYEPDQCSGYNWNYRSRNQSDDTNNGKGYTWAELIATDWKKLIYSNIFGSTYVNN